MRTSVYVWAQGGLGNQLFQLSAALRAAGVSETRLRCVWSWYWRRSDRQFELKPLLRPDEFASITECLLLRSPYDRSGSLKTAIRGVRVPISHETLGEQGALMVGYFQTAQDVLAVPEALVSRLLNVSLSQRAKQLSERIRGAPVVHVRRGDYVLSESARARFGLLGRDYYVRALDQVGRRLEDCYVFTDSPDRVSCEFGLDRDRIIGPDSQISPLETMLVMGSGSALVIPNSTFSWWAARASGGETPIVAPRVWFRDSPESNPFIVPGWTIVDAVSPE